MNKQQLGVIAWGLELALEVPMDQDHFKIAEDLLKELLKDKEVLEFKKIVDKGNEMILEGKNE